VPLELALPGHASDLEAAQARLWCDLLIPGSAQILARYQAGADEPGPHYAGRAAITLNHLGRGKAVYVGTLGDEALHDTLVGWLLATASVSPALNTPDQVEAVERWKKGQRLLFLLNHADQARDVVLPRPLTDLLTGQVAKGQIKLVPKAVMILREA
jgi:beta-galactosidase